MSTAISTLNNAAEHWWPYVFHATWQAALVAVVVLVIVSLFRRMPAPWRYALLLVALVKFIVPPIAPDKLGRFGLFTWVGPVVVREAGVRGQGSGVGSQGAEDQRVGGSEAQPTTHAAKPGLSEAQRSEGPGTASPPVSASGATATSAVADLTWKSWLMLLHAFGTIATLAWIAIGFCKLARIARRAQVIGPQASSLKSQALLSTFTALHKRLGLKEEIDLLITPEHIPPVAYWLLRPKIMLPQSLVDRLPPGDLETILAHELVHHRRNDWAANWLQLLTCAAWWFNPMAWLLNRTLRHTREECCDDALLAGKLTTHETYSRTLVTAAEQMAHSGALATTLGFGEQSTPIGKRLARILDPALKRTPKLSGAGLTVAAILCVAILPGLRSAPGQPQAPPVLQQLPNVLKLTVVDEETNRPISGATIEVYGPGMGVPQPANNQGLAEVRYDASKHQYLSVRAKAKGYVPMSMDFRRNSGIPDAYTLKLPRGTVIGGTVTDAEGRAVVGAAVKLSTTIPNLSGPHYGIGASIATFETDAQGRWHCDFVPKDLSTLNIEIEHSNFSRARYYSGAGMPTEKQLRDRSAVFSLRQGLSLEGTVVDHVGQPVTGASILLGQTHNVSNAPRVTTDDEGRFSFNQLTPGGTIVTVEANGFEPQLKEVTIAQDMKAVDFKLNPGHVLRGRVVDRDGKPIADASLLIRKWRGYETLAWRPKTDAEGRFEWRSAPADTVEVFIGKGGFLAVENYPLQAGEEEHLITLRPPLVVTGTVVDAESGQPVKNFTVRQGFGWKGSVTPFYDNRNVTEGRDGKFALSLEYPRNSYYVRVESDGYEPAVSPAFKDDKDQVAFDFRLKKGSGIAGTVVLPDGSPAASAGVGLVTPGHGAVIRNGKGINTSSGETTTTDAQGRFTVPKGDANWRLWIVHDSGYAEVSRADLEKSSRIQLQPWGRVEGTVHVGANPGKHEHVSLWFTDDTSFDEARPRIQHQGESRADESGHFVIDRVRPGRAGIGRRVYTSEFEWKIADNTPIVIESGKTTIVTIGEKKED